MPVTAMQPVALAARRLRVDRRVTLTERGRLPFPRPPRLLQQPLQLHDPSLTISDRLGQTNNDGLQLATTDSRPPIATASAYEHPRAPTRTR